ncbi:MAG: hypothetical protein HOW73_41240 [Polyangiaceae bacterium]|nr:hypothetical protein [Polyangiaceae bacterium]
MNRWTILLTVLLSGCGANVVFGEDPGDDGAGGGSNDGGAGGDFPTTSSANGGADPGGSLDARVVEVKFFADCMPEVGPDPISGSVFIEYRNDGTKPASLDIVSADIVFANPMEGWVFPISLSPTSSGAVGGGSTISLEHAKVATPGDSSFVCSLCGQSGTFSVDWSDGTSDSVDFQLSCGF